MSKGPSRFSSIGRPIDRRYPTNQAIAGLALVVAILGFAVRRLTGTHPLESFTGALVLAIGFFLAWAIARELDPDHDASAFVAAALSLVPQTVLGRPDLAGVLLILLVLRIVNRTVGPAAQPLDTIGILALVGVAVWRGQPVLALAAAGAFVLDAILDPAHRIHLAAAGASIGLLGVGLSRSAGTAPVPLTLLMGLALALMVPFLFLIAASGSPRTFSDTGGNLLRGRRVRAAQWLALAAMAGSILVGGQAGLASLSPLWAALVGVGAYFSIGAPTRLPHSVQDPS
ncbi:MAG: hypothetical protein M8861_06560 [marine benthic group bacterium]|nr:hypothetical protein [Gemmatimonadota bacterium]